MGRISVILSLSLLVVLLSGCGGGDEPGNGNGFEVEAFDPVPVAKSNPAGLWVHYMPWFETKETSSDGKWGQHWTMANKNPDIVDAGGKREIASWYYPLIGPYASSDAAVIEYHLLLMKYSGVDGILIDWYGTRDKYDYAANKANTEAIVKGLDKVGLKFAIVYEDQTLRDDLEGAARITQARADMQYLETGFFGKPNYVRIDGKPLLMVFGPQILKTQADWTSAFSGLKTSPAFVVLYGHSSLAGNTSAGEYIWVDATAMETKYAAKDDFDVFFGGAYPGFRDFYKEGGWGETLPVAFDPRDGALLESLLTMAAAQNVGDLQLITWNDFGEGTMIEPTREFGYKFLSEVQSFAGVSYGTSTLESIYDHYNLKKEYKGDAEAQKKLLQAFYYYISSQESKAREIVNELKKQ